MNVLITGAAGFIGTHIAIRLKSLGHTVIMADFDCQYTKFHTENFKIYDVDISKRCELASIEEKIDVIYHCAALSGVQVSNLDPDKCIDWNVKGTLNICDFAKENKCLKVIYTSTMAVYGEGDDLSESDEPDPISSYGVSKLAGEYLIKLLPQDNIDYTIFRLFNTYGPGQDVKDLTQGIVSIFLGQALRHKNIRVTGSLERYRDLIYIDDVISAMEMSLVTELLKNRTFNLCNNEKITIRSLIDIILEVHDDQKEEFVVEDVGGHKGDQNGVLGNNSLLKSKGWIPKIDLKEGIKRFYDHSKNIFSREEAWQKLEN